MRKDKYRFLVFAEKADASRLVSLKDWATTAYSDFDLQVPQRPQRETTKKVMENLLAGESTFPILELSGGNFTNCRDSFIGYVRDVSFMVELCESYGYQIRMYVLVSNASPVPKDKLARNLSIPNFVRSQGDEYTSRLLLDVHLVDRAGATDTAIEFKLSKSTRKHYLSAILAMVRILPALNNDSVCLLDNTIGSLVEDVMKQRVELNEKFKEYFDHDAIYFGLDTLGLTFFCIYLSSDLSNFGYRIGDSDGGPMHTILYRSHQSQLVGAFRKLGALFTPEDRAQFQRYDGSMVAAIKSVFG